MNARPPCQMTANPCADAERHENQCERAEAAAEAEKAQAYCKLLAATGFERPEDWFREDMPGPFGPSSWDEMLAEAIADGDQESLLAYASLMTSDAASRARVAVMAHMANKYARQINAA